MSLPVKESEITDEMLDLYIEKNKKLLGDKPTGDLITFDLAKIRDGEVEEGRKGMLNWYKSELARNGEILCDDCGKPMAQYYKAKCFHCKKPKIDEEDGSGNLMEATYWLENNEENFIRDEFWDSICDEFPGNDSYLKLHLQANNKQHRLFEKHFSDIKTWFVSW